MQVVFQQGEDRLVDLEFIDSGVPTSLADADEIVAILFVTINNVKTETYKYSLTTKTGYGKLVKKAGMGNEHIATLQLLRAETSTFSVGVFSVSVLVKFTDVDYPNDERHEEYTFNNVGRVTVGDTKAEV